jgi:homocysteine S-methyltransferase
MRKLFDQHDLILMEAAVVERLRRESQIDLHPRLVHADFVNCEHGREALRAIYQGYIDVAREASVPLLLCTPTWRANRNE